MRAPLAIALAASLALASEARPQTSHPEASGKIPITTPSEEARRLYLEARELNETFHLVEAYETYGRAVAADPDFALGHYGRALSSPTAATFFESYERAVELADRTSEPERRMILALKAGVDGRPEEQREHLMKLVASHPEDERAHFLMANFHNGRQEYEEAIQHYTDAIEINPSFTPAYNVLGYANRFLERYAEAERAFQKYIELLPDQPNPHDSYAELLMRMGRFDESIGEYRKALELDPEFTFSYVGIANNQMFLGKGAEARATLQELFDRAANDGLRRTALVWTAASYLHEGKREEAMDALRRMAAIAEKSGDLAALSGDMVLMGDVVLETGGSPDEALGLYEKGVEVIERADAPPDVKEATRRNHLYKAALVALRREDVEGAKANTETYRQQVDVEKIPFEVWQVHELAGGIALLEGDVDAGIAELEQSNWQDPRILWRLSRAYERKGDRAKARELVEDAAEFNQLNVAYAYVRNYARQALGSEANM